MLYTCYAQLASVNALRDFIGFINTPNDPLNPTAATGQSILEAAGLAQLPSNWRQAISDAFLSSADPTGNNLYLAEAVSGDDGNFNVNTNCTAPGVVGG